MDDVFFGSIMQGWGCRLGGRGSLQLGELGAGWGADLMEIVLRWPAVRMLQCARGKNWRWMFVVRLLLRMRAATFWRETTCFMREIQGADYATNIVSTCFIVSSVCGCGCGLWEMGVYRYDYFVSEDDVS